MRDDLHRFKGASFRETHLQESFGRTDKVALTTCLKNLKISGAFLSEAHLAQSLSALTKAHGVLTERLQGPNNKKTANGETFL